MLIGDNFLYFELHKTGCSHTKAILEKACEGSCSSFGKHTTFRDLPKVEKNNFSEKIKFGNIRNPWDWYVSLWAYGCMKKGEIYNRTIAPSSKFSVANLKFLYRNFLLNKRFSIPNVAQWEKAYADAENPENFQLWLKLIFESSQINLSGGYGSGTIAQQVGLLTFRYLNLYTRDSFPSKIKLSLESIKEYDVEENFTDFILRSENLHEELLSNAEKLHIPSKKLALILEQFIKRTNASNRKDYQYYYNNSSIDLVTKKEQFIIDKYKYHF